MSSYYLVGLLLQEDLEILVNLGVRLDQANLADLENPEDQKVQWHPIHLADLGVLDFQENLEDLLVLAVPAVPRVQMDLEDRLLHYDQGHP